MHMAARVARTHILSEHYRKYMHKVIMHLSQSAPPPTRHNLHTRAPPAAGGLVAAAPRTLREISAGRSLLEKNQVFSRFRHSQNLKFLALFGRFWTFLS